MADTQVPPLNEEAVRLLAEKLTAFVATLEPGEAQAVVALLNPARASDDVAGYAWWDLTTSSGWRAFISSALLGMVVSEGLIVDQHILEHFYGVQEPAAESASAAQAAATPSLRPQPAPAG